jgi:hypothetical protein
MSVASTTENANAQPVRYALNLDAGGLRFRQWAISASFAAAKITRAMAGSSDSGLLKETALASGDGAGLRQPRSNRSAALIHFPATAELRSLPGPPPPELRG